MVGTKADGRNGMVYELQMMEPTSLCARQTKTNQPNAISPSRRSTRRVTGLSSPHFNQIPRKSRPLAGTVSIIKVPPLSSDRFGLIQEEFAHDPFKLLVAVTLLNKTTGKRAIPVFRRIIAQWPDAAQLALASQSELFAILLPLGLQSRRTATIIGLARAWHSNPPRKDYRYRSLNYPLFGAGKDIQPGEVIDDGDSRIGAFEVAHIKGLGQYAYDSWRIFCRDELRDLACGWNGEGTDRSGIDETFEPEWKRVQPSDKELRAFLKWMWLKEEILWDADTGEKTIANEDVLFMATRGNEEEVVDDMDMDVESPITPKKAEERYLMPLNEQ